MAALCSGHFVCPPTLFTIGRLYPVTGACHLWPPRFRPRYNLGTILVYNFLPLVQTSSTSHSLLGLCRVRELVIPESELYTKPPERFVGRIGWQAI
jgi:hypothetical protein